MQAVSANVMRATIQDMQAYLRQLEVMLGMPSAPHVATHQIVSESQETRLTSQLQSINQAITTLNQKLDQQQQIIMHLSEQIQLNDKIQNAIIDVQDVQYSMLKDNVQKRNEIVVPTITCEPQIHSVWCDVPLDSALISSSVDALPVMIRKVDEAATVPPPIIVPVVDSPVADSLKVDSLVATPALNPPVMASPVTTSIIVTESVVVVEPAVTTSVVVTESAIAPVVVAEPVIKPVVAAKPIVVAEPVIKPVVVAEPIAIIDPVKVDKVESVAEQNQEEEEAESNQEEAESDQEEEEGIDCEEITYNGETYLKDPEGFIYKPDDDTPIGYWKEKTNSIAFYKTKK